VQIIALDDPLKRDFYAEMCRIERWSTVPCMPKSRVCSMNVQPHEKVRKLIKQELAALRDEDRMTPDLVFRDPIFLIFLAYPTHSANVTGVCNPSRAERFLLELGTDFTFVAW